MGTYRSWKNIKAESIKPNEPPLIRRFRYSKNLGISMFTTGQRVLLGTVCVAFLLLLILFGGLSGLFLILLLAAVPMIALWSLSSHLSEKGKQDEQDRIAQEKEDSYGYHNY